MNVALRNSTSLLSIRNLPRAVSSCWREPADPIACLHTTPYTGPNQSIYTSVPSCARRAADARSGTPSQISSSVDAGPRRQAVFPHHPRPFRNDPVSQWASCDSMWQASPTRRGCLRRVEPNACTHATAQVHIAGHALLPAHRGECRRGGQAAVQLVLWRSFIGSWQVVI